MCCRLCVKYRNVWVGLTDGTGEKKGSCRVVDCLENVTFLCDKGMRSVVECSVSNAYYHVKLSA